jgi:hypothetical protein
MFGAVVHDALTSAARGRPRPRRRWTFVAIWAVVAAVSLAVVLSAGPAG